MPMVLPTVGRRAPAKKPGIGPLWPAEGNPVGTPTPFSVHHPVNVDLRYKTVNFGAGTSPLCLGATGAPRS